MKHVVRALIAETGNHEDILLQFFKPGRVGEKNVLQFQQSVQVPNGTKDRLIERAELVSVHNNVSKLTTGWIKGFNTVESVIKKLEE